MKAEKFLIINADDFGLHSGVNRAIYEAHQKGVLTSTTLIACGSAVEEAAEMAQDLPNLGIGIHLTLVGDKTPILKPERITTLLDQRGLFRKNHLLFIKDWVQGKISKDEIFHEWSAQIEKASRLEIDLTHIDSHQHLHVLPGLTDLVLQLAKKYSIHAVRIPKEPLLFFQTGPLNPARIIARNGLTLCAWDAQKKWKHDLASPDHFYGMLAGGQMTLERWKNLVPILPLGVSEVMTHIGLCNQELGCSFNWNYHWQEEFAALQSEELTHWLTKSTVRLINYRSLTNPNLINGTLS